MPRTFLPAVLAWLLALSPGGAPSVASEVSTDAGARPMLFHGGRIRLNDSKGTIVEALLAERGKVVAVGSLSELERLSGKERWVRIDLEGATAVPGLQDSHGRIESYGASFEVLDLREAASYDEVVAIVAEQASKQERGTWVRGWGWDETRWEGRELPHHAALSHAVPDHPVFLERIDGHAALVDQIALDLAGLDGKLDPPPRIQGGRVLRDEQWLASGVLLDAAMDLVEKKMPQPTADDRRRRILAAQERLLAYGLTAVHDMGVALPTLDVLAQLAKEGELRLRVIAYPSGNERLTEDMVAKLPLVPGDDRLSVAGIELMADGALGSHGAALLDDYADAPGERGHMLLTREDLARRIALIAEAGLQPAIEAIGDRASRTVLDVCEEFDGVLPGFRALRPRIEHAQVVAPKDWPRFPTLGVVPSIQPVHATSDAAWVGDRLGPERTRGAYAWRRLAPELGRLAFGSDFPVESPDPLAGLYAARTRQDHGALPEDGFLPDQRLDGVSALMGFTSGAAFACHQEDRRGRLLPGYAADLTVIDVDPVTCDPQALLQARVRMTVVDGEIVYRR